MLFKRKIKFTWWLLTALISLTVLVSLTTITLRTTLFDRQFVTKMATDPATEASITKLVTNKATEKFNLPVIQDAITNTLTPATLTPVITNLIADAYTDHPLAANYESIDHQLEKNFNKTDTRFFLSRLYRVFKPKLHQLLDQVIYSQSGHFKQMLLKAKNILISLYWLLGILCLLVLYSFWRFRKNIDWCWQALSIGLISGSLIWFLLRAISPIIVTNQLPVTLQTTFSTSFPKIMIAVFNKTNGLAGGLALLGIVLLGFQIYRHIKLTPQTKKI